MYIPSPLRNFTVKRNTLYCNFKNSKIGEIATCALDPSVTVDTCLRIPCP